MSSLHVDGIENAIDNIDRVLTVLHSKEILQIFQVAGDAIVDVASGLVHRRTGLTQSAIFARAYQRDTVPYCIIGVEDKEPGHGHTVVKYAGFLEFGTVKMQAEPYIRPAADQMEGQLLSLVGDALGKLIQDQIH